MIRETILYLAFKINGIHPFCDRCVDTKKGLQLYPISFLEYIRNRRGNYIYCSLCWNFIHLMKGKCKKCNTTISRRDKWGVREKGCPKCFNMIKLEVKA